MFFIQIFQLFVSSILFYFTTTSPGPDYRLVGSAAGELLFAKPAIFINGQYKIEHKMLQTGECLWLNVFLYY